MGRRTFFNTVLVRSLGIGVAGDTLDALFEVVLGWSAGLRFLAFCGELANVSNLYIRQISQFLWP